MTKVIWPHLSHVHVASATVVKVEPFVCKLLLLLYHLGPLQSTLAHRRFAFTITFAVAQHGT